MNREQIEIRPQPGPQEDFLKNLAGELLELTNLNCTSFKPISVARGCAELTDWA